MQVLHSVPEILKALGGVTKVAALMGASYQRVHNWKVFGRLPPKTYIILQRALSDRGLAAPSSLWGIPERRSENLEKSSEQKVSCVN
jgi:hypothetical protein